MLSHLRTQVIAVVKKSLKEFVSDGQLPPVILEIPQDKQHGEFACNAAMRLAGILKKNPLELAETIRAWLEKNLDSTSLKGKIKKVEVKKPGFINFFLSDEAFQDILASVFAEGEQYGRSKSGAGKKIQIEFVSANPTGPLSVAHARQAAVGDALGNILKAIGYQVTKEFYLNDEGNQINILGRSLQFRAREILGEAVQFPEEGYQGEYIRDMAREFMNQRKIKSLDELNAVSPAAFLQFGVEHLWGVIKKELADFGVHFDVWSQQSQIATDKNIAAVLSFLREKGFVYDQEGALWFKSTLFGDDKDRVVRKSDGSCTYLAPDIVYHQDKFKRGFDKIINIWGPDHHGYIPRIKAAVEALGYDPEALTVLIVQLATIFRDGKPLSMSTRRGQYIELREVMTEVGTDAARFFFLMRHTNAHLEFDLELAKKETPENPVYYIQYAHARIHSLLKLAQESKLLMAKAKWNLLNKPAELDLLKQLGLFQDILYQCGHQTDPFALVSYLQELAASFHRFYDQHRIIGDDKDISRQRLALSEATRIVLGNGLKLLGVRAPEKM